MKKITDRRYLLEHPEVQCFESQLKAAGYSIVAEVAWTLRYDRPGVTGGRYGGSLWVDARGELWQLYDWDDGDLFRVVYAPGKIDGREYTYVEVM